MGPIKEHKAVAVSGLKALGDQEEGVVETIVSVTGIRDNVNDVILPGAYEKSLKVRTPKGVWHHNWHESISRTEDIKELLPGDPELPDTMPDGSPWPPDAGALKVKTRFNLNTQRGRDAYEDVKFFGDSQNWSIGYNVPTGGATVDSKTGVRRIHTLDLYEYSPVLFGAMPSAHTTSVKSVQQEFKTLSYQEQQAFLIEAKSELESKGGPAVHGDDEEEEPTDDEEVPVEEEEEEEEEELDEEVKAFFENLFSPETKGAVSLSPGQIDLLQQAINSLQNLLTAVNQNVSTGEDVQKKEMPFPEAVAEVFDDADLEKAAQEFQDAYDDKDADKMEESAEPIMSALEKAKEDGEEDDNLKEIASVLIKAFEDVEKGEEESEPADDEKKKPKDEEGEEESTEKKSISLDELSELLD